MTKVTDPKDPSKKWKMEILQEEIDCNRDFLTRCESHDEEEYIMVKEMLIDLEQWMDDLKNNSTDMLSDEDLNWRENVLKNQITMHQGVLTGEPSLTSEDRRVIKGIIEDLKEWKRYLQKWKKAFC
ncbi:MAG: hypothetical protein U9R75_04015 [Candidatus Thermoplasmatota archaeon]|nr:hypothetical protein [Candidatus Thermoplasmatota archaeon]